MYFLCFDDRCKILDKCLKRRFFLLKAESQDDEYIDRDNKEGM